MFQEKEETNFAKQYYIYVTYQESVLPPIKYMSQLCHPPWIESQKDVVSSGDILTSYCFMYSFLFRLGVGDMYHYPVGSDHMIAAVLHTGQLQISTQEDHWARENIKLKLFFWVIFI